MIARRFTTRGRTLLAAMVAASLVAVPAATLAQDESPGASPAAESPAAASPAAASPAGSPATEPSAPVNPYPEQGAIPGSGEGKTIGYISLGEYIPFAALVTGGIQEQAEIAGANLVWCDSNTDPAKTLECAQQMATQGAQGVINFQVDQAQSPEYCEAYGNVPTIAIDIRQAPCENVFYGANNHEAGRLAGANIGQYAKDTWDCDYNAYVSLESTGAADANAQRMGGFRDGFQEFCPLVNETVLADADRTDKALPQMTDLLPSLPGNRIVVVAINEDGILGAIGAARTLGREADLFYAGQGADPSIWPEIACNPQYIGTVAYFPERYGRTVVPAMIDLLDGKEVSTPLYTAHEVVTAENIRDIYPETAECPPG